MENNSTEPFVNFDSPIVTPELKIYLRQNKLTIEKYFVSKLNKKDLLTGELIPFNNLTQYVTIDFVNKKNIAKWLSKLSKEQAREYLKRKIKQRVTEKAAKYEFTQVELRSIKYIPAIDIILKYFDKYSDAYEGLGLKQKFDYTINIKNDEIEPSVILVDTREQNKLIFRYPTITQKLDFGDYTYSAQHYNEVHFERKSIQDLFGTMSKLNLKKGYGDYDSNYDRFTRELERAAKQDCYIIVLVDYPYYKAQSYNHNQRFSKMNAENVFHNIREFTQKHDNLQFLFTGSREESVRFIEKAVSFRDSLRKIDLQYYLDEEKITLN